MIGTDECSYGPRFSKTCLFKQLLIYMGFNSNRQSLTLMSNINFLKVLEILYHNR